VADIAACQQTDPDPDDLENEPAASNPFGLAALADGSVLVADAGANDLLRVWPDGSIVTVARRKPRTVAVPEGLPDSADGQPLPPAGAMVPSEAVATSVTVGADGCGGSTADLRRRRPHHRQQHACGSWVTGGPGWPHLTARISRSSGHGLGRQPAVPLDCCCITGAGRPRPGQEAWPRPSQCPVSWLTTICR